jgi:hypothetical protein
MIPVLDKMHMLNAESFTTSQHRAGVVRLVHVLKHYPQVTRAPGKDFLKPGNSFLRNKSTEVCYQF